MPEGSYNEVSTKPSLRLVEGLARSIRTAPRFASWWQEHHTHFESEESAGPLWLAASSLLRVRAGSRAVASLRPGLRPLRLTLHVGEEFPHLLTGLRAIDEPFALGLIERGDRLGHALALGLDPSVWVRDVPIARLRRWDRVLDLVWARRTCAEAHAPMDGSAYADLDRELRVHLGALGADPGLGDALLTRLTDPWGIDHAVRDTTGDAAARAIQVASTTSDRHTGWHEVIEVETERDLPWMLAVGRPISVRVARWQCVIEVNPSSNLLVGRLYTAFSQPLFHLPGERRDEPWAVPVLVGTDDPAVFATSLGDEFAYAWAGMVDAHDVPSGYARAWIDEAAAHSWRMRFTTPGVTRRTS